MVGSLVPALTLGRIAFYNFVQTAILQGPRPAMPKKLKIIPWSMLD